MAFRQTGSLPLQSYILMERRAQQHLQSELVKAVRLAMAELDGCWGNTADPLAAVGHSVGWRGAGREWSDDYSTVQRRVMKA